MSPTQPHTAAFTHPSLPLSPPPPSASAESSLHPEQHLSCCIRCTKTGILRHLRAPPDTSAPPGTTQQHPSPGCSTAPPGPVAMRLLPAVTCFLAALFSGGHSLVCDTCSNSNGDSCTGPANTCDAAQDTCIATLTETIKPKGKTQSFYKSCGKSKDCKVMSSLSNEQVKIISSSKCCNTDRCTPEAVTVPRRDTLSNGIVCAACYSPSADECTGQEKVTCAGVENKCIKYGMPIQAGGDAAYAMRGCANQAMCDSKGKLAFPGMTAELKKFECNHGTQLQHNFSFSTLIGLLLLFKLLS